MNEEMKNALSDVTDEEYKAAEGMLRGAIDIIIGASFEVMQNLKADDVPESFKESVVIAVVDAVTVKAIEAAKEDKDFGEDKARTFESMVMAARIVSLNAIKKCGIASTMPDLKDAVDAQLAGALNKFSEIKKASLH